MKKTTIMFAIMLGVASKQCFFRPGRETDLDQGGVSAEGREQQPLSRLDQEADLRPHDSTSWFGSDL